MNKENVKEVVDPLLTENSIDPLLDIAAIIEICGSLKAFDTINLFDRFA
jgi:hypothetical protein